LKDYFFLGFIVENFAHQHQFKVPPVHILPKSENMPKVHFYYKL